MIDVLMVTREEMDGIAGLPWADAIEGRGTKRIDHGYTTQQKNDPGWTEPLDHNQKPLLYLPLNHAWLRKVDDRAFLYLQNW